VAAHIEKDEVCATARLAVPSAGCLAFRLVKLVNEGCGTDNCTVATAYCLSDRSSTDCGRFAAAL